MTRASLRPYLRLIPLFEHLSCDEQSGFAEKLVNRHLAGGETLDLRGSCANVLCIVTRGRVRFESCLRDNHISQAELNAGQWAGEDLILGRGQAIRTRLSAYTRQAEVLLLWQQDLRAMPGFGRLITFAGPSSLISSVPRNILEALRHRVTSCMHVLSVRARRRPVAAGAFIALAFFMSLLLFTRPGRALQADWRYLKTVHQFQPSQEGQARQLSHVLRLIPDHPLGAVALGNLAARSGDLDTAMRHYAAVAEINGAGANNLGVMLLRQNDPEAALQAFLLSIRLDPDIAVPYQNLGIAYQQMGQQREAVQFFKEALRIDPGLTVARYHLGMYYLSQHDLVEAGAAFERVVEHDVSCAQAYLGLGILQMEIGEPARAVDAFHQATQLESNSVVVLFYLGLAQATMGHREEAETTLARLLELNPAQDLAGRIDLIIREGASDAP